MRLSFRVQVVISIHALREEGDGYYHSEQQAYQDISIHALREEGDAAICHL